MIMLIKSSLHCEDIQNTEIKPKQEIYLNFCLRETSQNVE